MSRDSQSSGFSELSFSGKLGIVFGGVLVAALCALLVFRITFVTFVDSYELGYVYHARTGEIERLSRTGYVVAVPFLNSVHTLDLRPGQVCMNANSRVLNCKLVRFNLDGFDKFIEWHGRGAGEGGSSTSTTGQSGVYEILKSYAFNVNEGRDCPFLEIWDDMRRKDVAPEVSPTPSPESSK